MTARAVQRAPLVQRDPSCAPASPPVSRPTYVSSRVCGPLTAPGTQPDTKVCSFVPAESTQCTAHVSVRHSTLLTSRASIAAVSNFLQASVSGA